VTPAAILELACVCIRTRDEIFHAGQLVLAILASIACVLALFLALGPWVLTGQSIEEFRNVDELYYVVATQLAQGLVPYRDFDFQYPIGSLPQVFFPILAGPSVRAYRLAYIAEMLVINALSVLALAWHVDRQEGRAEARRRLIWYVVCFLFLGRLVVSRLDMFPTLLLYLAALSWTARRPILWGTLAALGGLVKVFPALVALPGSLGELSRPRSSRLRGTLAFSLWFVMGLALWYLLGGSGMVNSIRYHTERSFEIESVYAGLIMLTSRLRGIPFSTQLAHQASELVSDLSPALLRASRYIQFAILVLSLFPITRSDSNSGLRCCCALTLAFMVTSPVLSPQFLIWILPLVLSVGGSLGRPIRPLYVLICALTFMLYPVFFDRWLVSPRLLGILLLNLRNTLLIGLWLLMTFGSPKTELSQVNSTGPSRTVSE